MGLQPDAPALSSCDHIRTYHQGTCQQLPPLPGCELTAHNAADKAGLAELHLPSPTPLQALVPGRGRGGGRGEVEVERKGGLVAGIPGLDD